MSVKTGLIVIESFDSINKCLLIITICIKVYPKKVYYMMSFYCDRKVNKIGKPYTVSEENLIH